MTRFLALASLSLVIVTACDTDTRRPDPEVKAVKSEPAAAPAKSAASPQASADAPAAVDDPALHRTYGAADMKLAACAKLLDDGTIEGHDCEKGIVLYGPYASIPKDVDVKISFDISSKAALSVGVDTVSQVGKRFHAAMEETPVEGGHTRHVGLTIHVFESTVGFENRIWLQSSSKASFKITNLALVVP